MRTYEKEYLSHIAYPIGGIGAGMFCINGTGMLGGFSFRHKPDLYNEPNIFSAIYVRTKEKEIAKVIEGQVPKHKIYGSKTKGFAGMWGGLFGKNYGLPRLEENNFTSQFPFATLEFKDKDIEIDIVAKVYSPFIPLDTDNSSLPVGTIEYTFTNNTLGEMDCVYYINTINFVEMNYADKVPVPVAGYMENTRNSNARIYQEERGFLLHQKAEPDKLDSESTFYIRVEDENAKVNTNWFDREWFDSITMQWNDINKGIIMEEHREDNRSSGASIAVGFKLARGESKIIPIHFAWFTPKSDLIIEANDGKRLFPKEEDRFSPWYAKKFNSVSDIMEYYVKNYKELYDKTKSFSDALYSSQVEEIILEAVGANLSILKSPTILRQSDGKMWAWEGCQDDEGSCDGSCTHVWNYAQAICHLFPDLERSLRNTEFCYNQNEKGHQEFRANLPIRKSKNLYHAAADGQLGGIIKMYREWTICGDNSWLHSYFEKMKESLDYCIKTWDPKLEGVLKEPHHNTFDIEFWGADSMCSSFYLGALKAFSLMGEALEKDVEKYQELYIKGKFYLENKLFNGEYFYQKVEWKTLNAPKDFLKNISKDLSIKKSTDTTLNEIAEIPKFHLRYAKLIEEEGPKYQYGIGCLSDGLVGAWLSKICGLGDILDPEKIKSHLLSVYKYNFKESLMNHANPQRPSYAIGSEAGLVVCTWPKGGKPSLPFTYSDEVWTGIEYQVASHLMLFGYEKEALDIIRGCRNRYQGDVRNPYSEFECGHYYARALASYSLLQAVSGVRYDAVTKILYVKDKSTKVFICTNTGYGMVHVKDKKVTVKIIFGNIEIDLIKLEE